jgi:hypothetical protein
VRLDTSCAKKLKDAGLNSYYMTFSTSNRGYKNSVFKSISKFWFGLISGDPASNEVHRGCFNRAIATLITENESLGCLEIPPKYGKGMICLCDTELCNSAQKVVTSQHAILLLVSLTFAIWRVHNLLL